MNKKTIKTACLAIGLLALSQTASAITRDEVCGLNKATAAAAIKAKQIMQDEIEKEANKEPSPLESCLDGLLNGSMLPDFGFSFDLGSILDSVLNQACSAIVGAVNEPIDSVNGELGSWGQTGSVQVGNETVDVFGTQIRGGYVGNATNGYQNQFGSSYNTNYQDNDVFNLKDNFRNRLGSQ